MLGWRIRKDRISKFKKDAQFSNYAFTNLRLREERLIHLKFFLDHLKISIAFTLVRVGQQVDA
jgi:hypothetical protein